MCDYGSLDERLARIHRQVLARIHRQVLVDFHGERYRCDRTPVKGDTASKQMLVIITTDETMSPTALLINECTTKYPTMKYPRQNIH